MLGTRDYCHKNSFDRVWDGLSGGLDSAVVLAMAVDAFGADRVTAVRLPSRYNAALSNDLAEEKCRELEVHWVTLSIEEPFRGFLDALASCSRRCPSMRPRRICNCAPAARC